MKRLTALRLYRFLFFAQVFSLSVGFIDLLSELRSGIHLYLIGFMVGGIVGVSMAILWFRQWKGIESASEEQWNQAWFIQRPKGN